MKLTWKGIRERERFAKAGIRLPAFDVERLAEETRRSPRWVHFGVGNIFRIFMGTIADDLIEAGELDRGITGVETFDFDVVDRIHRPYDNLALCVTLHGDGSADRRVAGSLTETIAARPEDAEAQRRLREIFRDPGLQMVSCTITEKGYELARPDGTLLDFVRPALEEGPDAPHASAMTLIAALLKERCDAGGAPIALVSMDNVSQNGKKFRESVLTVADAWEQRGFLTAEEAAYIRDESRVAFPWTMIDKITPRPDEAVGAKLREAGMEDMDIVVTSRRTYIAPFVNAEGPQYLVIEDHFPNGRPPFEKAGVYMTDRETVNACERMKVTVCLNPIHSALGPYGVLLGYERFSDVIRDRELLALAELVGPQEGMKVVVDPGILSPAAFLQELLEERFPNPYIPDTPQRLCTDISQGLGVRFGVTIRAYCERFGSAAELSGIPLAIAGWLRYLLGVTDTGEAYELAPDPLNAGFARDLKERGIGIGNPEAVGDALHPILSNVNIFGIDLYEAGIGERIEDLFRREIAGFGAVRETLQKELRAD